MSASANPKKVFKTATVFCDGSSDFSSVDKGKYDLNISLQLISFLILIILGTKYFLGFPKKTTRFFSKRFDLFLIPGIEKLVRSKYFSIVVRLIPALLFIAVLATGFMGRSKASFAAPFVWMFWWTLLIFLVTFFGKIFCAICPWDFFANLYQYGFVYKIKKMKENHLKKWPKVLKNVYPAAIFFIVLTWFELGFEITKNSYVTAVLGLIVVMLAIAIPVFFEKRAFCRYLCPVGRISGMYSIFAPMELRIKSRETCNTCKTKECVKGNEYSSPCPMDLIPFNLSDNTYCTLCTECVRSCEKENLTINIRPFASEINTIKPKTKSDESALAMVMYALTFFHGITMVYPWFQVIDQVRNGLQLSYLSAFSLLMTAFMLISFGSYIFLDKLISILTKNENSFRNIAICLIPITLAYHLGHNVMHVFGEVPYLVPLMNDPFGWGWDILGARGFNPKPLLFHEDVLGLQVGLVLLGFYFSIKTLRIKLESFGDRLKENVFEFQFLYFIGFSTLFFTAIFSLWLIGQPMVTRGGI